VRIDDNKEVASGVMSGVPFSISADGFTTNITSGSFAGGDSFVVSPTRNAMQACNVVLNDPRKLAMAFPVSAEVATTNKGSGSISVDSIIDTNNASFSVPKQLNPPVRIEFLSPTTYQLVDANTNTAIEGPLTYDPSSTSIFPTPGGFDPGYRVTIRGDIKSGDTFNLQYNLNTSGDNRNAIAFASLYSKKYFDNSNLTLNDAYHLMSNTISLKTYSTKIELDSSISIYNQAEQRLAEISGVSNIEEVANLAQYQEAYQASAQVIQVAKSIFETIINLSR
jgi:flagellar hook-associated protein 1 FlgK